MEKLEINVSPQLQRKIEILSRELGLSKEETVIFLLNYCLLEKSEIIYKAVENL